MTEQLALIVEDDPQIGAIFSIALQGEFTTEVIPDGAAALARLGEIVPKIVILDMHLPNMSGAELYQYIQAQERLAGTRTIICTADGRQAELMHDHADIVMVKPVSPIQLRELAIRLRSL
jgi:DNA-binding response OmpR family regulator